MRQNRPMKVGYMRHTGAELKRMDTQLAALHSAGCETVYADDAASKGARLAAALGSLNAGDILIVTKFDRLGKTIRGVVDLLNQLAARSVTFVAIEDAVDTSTAEGRYLLGVMARLALMDKALVNVGALFLERVEGGGRVSTEVDPRLAYNTGARARRHSSRVLGF